MISLKPLSAGDVIFDCKPLLHVIDSQFKGKYCDNCLKLSDLLKRCSKCLQMYYCDKSCQQIDWIYHKNECKLFARKPFDPKREREERLLIRLYLCLKSNQTFATKRHQLSDGSDVCLNDIEVNVEELKKSMKLMIVFNKLAKSLKEYGMKFEIKELLHWFGLLWTKAMSYRIGITSQTSNYFAVGFGLYIETSVLSHSCLPNSAIIVANNEHCLEVRAMKSIGFGEEITISFVGLAQNQTKRLNELKTIFLIDCKCLKCSQSLDSKVDYKLFDDFLNILFQKYFQQKMSKDLMKTIESVFRDICSEVTIYGEYYPQKSLILALLLSECESKHSNREFVQQLRNCYEDCLRVTYRQHRLFSHIVSEASFEFGFMFCKTFEKF